MSLRPSPGTEEPGLWRGRPSVPGVEGRAPHMGLVGYGKNEEMDKSRPRAHLCVGSCETLDGAAIFGESVARWQH